MKIVKYILFSIATLLIIVLIAALLVKKNYAVRQAITINKNATEVFNYLKYLRNQDEFSKWAKMDPTMKKSYEGVDGTVGFISAWESKADSVGKGEQEIIAIQEGKRIDYELRFIEPFESTEKAYITVDSIAPLQTKVLWGFEGTMNYPMNLMLVVMDMEKMIGNDLATGLQNLKQKLEQPTP